MTSVNSDSFPRNIKSLLFRKLNSFFASHVFDVKSENEHMMQPFFRRILRNSMAYDTILSPIIDDISVNMKNKRQKVAGSWKKRMPTKTVPTAPIPVHTA